MHSVVPPFGGAGAYALWQKSTLRGVYCTALREGCTAMCCTRISNAGFLFAGLNRRGRQGAQGSAVRFVWWDSEERRTCRTCRLPKNVALVMHMPPCTHHADRRSKSSNRMHACRESGSGIDHEGRGTSCVTVCGWTPGNAPHSITAGRNACAIVPCTIHACTPRGAHKQVTKQHSTSKE